MEEQRIDELPAEGRVDEDGLLVLFRHEDTLHARKRGVPKSMPKPRTWDVYGCMCNCVCSVGERITVRPLLTSAFTKTSLDRTSSFFCSSPCIFFLGWLLNVNDEQLEQVN